MRIHLLGICGTFMAGLALLARELGLTVSGSDSNVYPPMSTQLAGAGITVSEGYDPEQFRHLDPGSDLVVVGNAMTRGNPAVEFLLNSRLRYTSGPQWLADHVLHGRWLLAVAGTHGKTTTSSMLAWILEWADLAPGFLIGGIPDNFACSARLGREPFFVVEADEYDSAFFDKRSKFIHYRSRTLILNNLEYDHADIFADLDAIQRQFHHLVRAQPGEGLIICNRTDSALEKVLTLGCWTPVETFAGCGDWQARLLKPDGSVFEVRWRDQLQGTVEWSQLGEHNVANALAAIAAARHAGVPGRAAVTALGQFKGVKRRLEHRGCVGTVNLYDDFAHHPSAIRATLAALRGKVAGERIIAILELRSNTMRSGVFNASLAASLRQADLAIVLYTGPPEALSDHHTLELCTSTAAIITTVLDQVAPHDHILVMSNGSFDNLHQRLLDALAQRTSR